MNHLEYLEEESIYILREVAAQFNRPVILFSGGKDSTLLIHLARKAFTPCPLPFLLLHIDTGHNFPETLSFRDHLCKSLNLQMIIRGVTETLHLRNIPEPIGKFPSRNAIQSQTLLDAIAEFKFDACIGGGRRDEEKARSKERIFSIRDKHGAWQPYSQRPELWNIYNGKIHEHENMRVFPISNWSELDVWNYIRKEHIELPELYFSHQRNCILYENKLIAVSEFMVQEDGDTMLSKQVRYRTVGDMTCTAAIESNACSIDEVINEIEHSEISERGETRMDDRLSDSAMEERKLKGYF